MAFDSLALEELEPVGNRIVVCVALRHIAVPSGEMTRHEAKGRIEQVESNTNTALVPTQTLQTGLSGFLSRFSPDDVRR